MARDTKPVKIHADFWDDDEFAWLRPKLSLPAAFRVQLHGKQVKFDGFTDEADVATSTEHLAKALMEMLDSWTLRDPATSYEPGVDRPKRPLTIESIVALDGDDLFFLYGAAMQHFKVTTASTPPAGELITPDAEADGATPANFRPDSTTDGDIPGGSEMAEPLRYENARRMARG